MKASIQRFPEGLFQALGIRASEAPPLLADEVAGVLELAPYYLASRLETQVALAAGVNTSGAEVTLTVPAGEYWFVYNIAATASNITVGSNVQIACGYRTPDNLGPAQAAMTSPVVAIAGQQVSVSGQPVGVLLKPGCIVFASTHVAPTSLDLRVWVQAARLRPN